MNYNMPFNPFNSMVPNYESLMKIETLEQEILKLKNIINTLDQRINKLEEKSLKKDIPGYLNSNVANNDGSLYML
ncbi:MAG: hypothetical protein IKO49_03225 [Bacilli bacterium]|nr:hypothetical protein [Bacilli bacterium]